LVGVHSHLPLGCTTAARSPILQLQESSLLPRSGFAAPTYRPPGQCSRQCGICWASAPRCRRTTSQRCKFGRSVPTCCDCDEPALTIENVGNPHVDHQ
jgi:hypothetical protein